MARLHLQRGDVQVAVGEYRFLAGAALRAHDLNLAESLIQEVLAVEPNSVPLLELNGELYEEKGDHAVAALQYAKAVDVLLAHPEPGMESLHEELFEKVQSLAPDADFVKKLAERVKKGATGAPNGGQEEVRIEEPFADRHDEVLGRGPAAQEIEEMTIVGAEPDVVSYSANIFARDDEPQAITTAQGQEAHARAEDILSASTVDPPVTSTVDQSSVPHSNEASINQLPSSTTILCTSTETQTEPVKEPAGTPPDYETHYALGVAYKNMGLYEEAHAAFQVSIGSDAF